MKLWRMGGMLVGVLVFACLTVPAVAQVEKNDGYEGDRDVLEGGNLIYRIFIQDDPDSGKLGTFAPGTGSEHPKPLKNIFFGAYFPTTNPFSSYITIRSYTTETDYISRRDSASSDFAVLNLSEDGEVHVIDQGFETVWTVNNPPDLMTITQTTVVQGEAEEDSRIQVTVSVRNDNETGGPVLEVGTRYLWDLMIGESDDAWFKKIPGTEWTQEFLAYPDPVFDAFATSNSNILGDQIFQIIGTVSGDFPLDPMPTPPELLTYAFWGEAYDDAWDHDPSGSAEDSCVLYYWGAERGIPLNPGEEWSVTAYLTAEVDNPPPPPKNVPALDLWGGLILIAVLGGLIVLRRRGA